MEGIGKLDSHPKSRRRTNFTIGMLERASSVLILFTCYVVLAAPSPAAAAELTHVFDPTLSLTGNCSETAIDPVPDPGLCPMPPGVPGSDHPNQGFSFPRAVAVDDYGNIYVGNYGADLSGTDGRIDVFRPDGAFISELLVPGGPTSLAVDSVGTLYVAVQSSGALLRYEPTLAYDPAAGAISYADPTTVLPKETASAGLAVNPTDDHLFLKWNYKIEEFGSAAEDNPVVDTFGEGELSEEAIGLAIDAVRNRIYAASWEGSTDEKLKSVKAFDLTTHDLLFTIHESDLPGEDFVASFLSLAADEADGHLFVFDGNAKKVYEFDATGTYVSTVEFAFQSSLGSKIAVDDGPNSPNGGYLFVPSHPTGLGHSFAFAPIPDAQPPAIEEVSTSGATESETVLHAIVNPNGAETTYRFEYIAEHQFQEEGESYKAAKVAAEGFLPAGHQGIPVSVNLTELQPGTMYRFRLSVHSKDGDAEDGGRFGTYRIPDPSTECPNQYLRTGESSSLPDCRAYELVTPANTNGHAPVSLEGMGQRFYTRSVSPSGDKVGFFAEGGPIPGFEGAGSLFGDPYLATRGAAGWETEAAAPDGSASDRIDGGSRSPDQEYSFWDADGVVGWAQLAFPRTNYLRYPDGHSELVGRGSLGDDPSVEGKLIGEGGRHIIFKTTQEPPFNNVAVQLEPNAPPSGTATIYDRTIDPVTGAEQTHVVSLLPGDVTPAAGSDAGYLGASLDGEGVGFRVGGKIYLRYHNQETYEVAGADAVFAGLAEGGARIFFTEDGDLWRFEAPAGGRVRFTDSGDITPVNISADGSTAYFVSPSVLPVTANPQGALPIKGSENLYRSQEGSLQFIGVVTKSDVAGKDNGGKFYDGLGLWNLGVAEEIRAADPSRTNPDGSVLLFQSAAPLTEYDSQGHVEIYRYDASSPTLQCLSCNSTGAAQADDTLESHSFGLGEPEPLDFHSMAGNLRPDGRRAFFESTEALVASDTDGLRDVYEWEDEGVGSCITARGCLYLISSGTSGEPDYLVGVSASGDDVFFRSGDLLLRRDGDQTPSIYDARVGGGFPEPAESSGECLGEACQPTASPPARTPLASAVFRGSGNVKEGVPKLCRKRRHASRNPSRRGTRPKCIRSAKHHHQKRRSGAKGRTH